MPKFRVTVPAAGEWVMEVEAEDTEDAIERFEPGYICANCSGMGNRSEAYYLVNDEPDYDRAEAEVIS